MSAEVRTKGWRRDWPPPLVFAIVLVPFIIESVGVFWPTAQGIYLSFLNWNGVAPAKVVGLGNYFALANDPIFYTALRNTAIWLVLFGGIAFVGGLAAALLLQSERRGVGIYRSALFLPTIFSLVVTATIWDSILQPSGVLNSLLSSVGLGGLRQVWLGNPQTALYVEIGAALWRQIGYVMVLFIAGLKAIDPTLTEAARVDGASAIQRFRFVTFPQLRGVNLVISSVLVIDSLRSFDIVYSLTGGGPYHSTELLSTYMFSTAFTGRQLGYASALAVVILLLALGFIVTYLSRAFAKEED